MSTSPDRGPRQSTTSPNGVPLAAAPFVFDLTERHVDAADLELVQVFRGSFGSVKAYNAPDGVYISCQVFPGSATKTCLSLSLLEYLGEAAKLGGAQLMKTGVITQERTIVALQNCISKAIKTERLHAVARVGSEMAPQQQIAASLWGRVRITNWHMGEAQTRAGERLFDIRVRMPEQAPRKGRPQEHDWEGARAFAEKYVEQHGLPKIQARLIEALEDWFVKNDPPKAPDRRLIRVNIIKRFYE